MFKLSVYSAAALFLFSWQESLMQKHEQIPQFLASPVVSHKKGVVNIFDEQNRIVTEKIPFYVGAKLSHSWLGKKLVLPVLKSPLTAKVFGWYKGSWISKFGIKRYCRKHKINLDDFTVQNPKEFKSYNDFFTRKLSPAGMQKRTPDPNPQAISSPADSKILAVENLNLKDRFWIKETNFSLEEFLKKPQLAKEFNGGKMAICRLAPHDYHRFHAPLDFVIKEKYHLDGRLDSVNPYAYAKNCKPLIQNKRLVIVAENPVVGKFLIVPVGAMLVGSIKLHDKTQFCKGEELGWFEFGGSTIVLVFNKNSAVHFDSKILRNSFIFGLETKVMVGKTIAKKS